MESPGKTVLPVLYFFAYGARAVKYNLGDNIEH